MLPSKERGQQEYNIIMEEAQGDDEVFVYMGGNQQVPDGVRRARIHKSVKIVRARAFQWRRNLIYVECHDGVEIIEEEAFASCWLLKGPIKLLGVKIIKKKAFFDCFDLTDVEFGDQLETIEEQAFYNCTGLSKIRMPSVRTIGRSAFSCCYNLSDVDLGEGLCVLHRGAFCPCHKLKRVALPLKVGLIQDGVFNCCNDLTTIDLVGGVHQTVASLHLESWRNEMNNEINRINQTLATIRVGRKTPEIQQWMRIVIHRLERYKFEHLQLLKDATTLLELALWKANLDDNEGGKLANEGVRITRGSRKRARKEVCVTSGADVVIKNVLPFLQLLG